MQLTPSYIVVKQSVYWPQPRKNVVHNVREHTHKYWSGLKSWPWASAEEQKLHTAELKTSRRTATTGLSSNYYWKAAPLRHIWTSQYSWRLKISLWCVAERCSKYKKMCLTWELERPLSSKAESIIWYGIKTLRVQIAEVPGKLHTYIFHSLIPHQIRACPTEVRVRFPAAAFSKSATFGRQHIYVHL